MIYFRYVHGMNNFFNIQNAKMWAINLRNTDMYVAVLDTNN